MFEKEVNKLVGVFLKSKYPFFEVNSSGGYNLRIDRTNSKPSDNSRTIQSAKPMFYHCNKHDIFYKVDTECGACESEAD